MRVLCVDQFSNWGGGQRSLLDLLPSFAARGWQPHVLLPDDGPFEAELRKLNYPVLSLGSAKYSSIRKPPIEMLRYAADLPRVARSIETAADSMDATILYINGPRVLPPAAWVARRKKIPLVFHCHHFLQQPSSVLLSGASLQMSDAYSIASCRFAADPIKRYVRPERLFVRYNGVAGPDRPWPRPTESQRRIGVIGRIEQEKRATGICSCCPACCQIVSRMPFLHCWLADVFKRFLLSKRGGSKQRSACRVRWLAGKHLQSLLQS